MINSFWWGSNRRNGRWINWLSWDRTMRKEYGGTGFRHLYGFNLTMSWKQGWRIATNHDAIGSCIFKARYFSKEDFVGNSFGS